jgi:hypothetical protein
MTLTLVKPHLAKALSHSEASRCDLVGKKLSLIIGVRIEVDPITNTATTKNIPIFFMSLNF